MKIRTKILLSYSAVALAVALVCLAIVGALVVGSRNQRHLQASYEQIRSINLIAAYANDYSEQVAELFILDPSLSDEVEAARGRLYAELDHKRSLVEAELEFIRDPAGRAREAMELQRIEAMRTTLHKLEDARLAIQAALVAGQREAADAIYREQVEHRLDGVLGALIDSATLNEREEVEDAIADAERISRRSMMLVGAVVGLVTLLGVANALVLDRSISRPIAALAAGTEAVGRGDFDHTVVHQGRDELGDLAARFNLMTGQIREHRDRLVEAQATLAQQVDDRTRELRERGEDLEAAVARLRAVDASRAQFLADISHELRTPLTILRGQSEIALRDAGGGEAELRETLTLVLRKAEQMSRLVEDILFLARSEAGAIPVRLAPVALQDVVADVLFDSQALSRRQGVTISPRQPSEPLMVEADAERLRQAILIALDNAVKYAPAGSSVVLEAVACGDRAAIRVCDRGPGFAPDEIGGAFQRFYRGLAARAPSRGTGLGLSIAKWIVDQHNGVIRIDSRPGEGATVIMDLPRLRPA